MFERRSFAPAIGLILIALMLVACGSPATPTPVPPTLTPVPATPTPVPPIPPPEPTATPTFSRTHRGRRCGASSQTARSHSPREV